MAAMAATSRVATSLIGHRSLASPRRSRQFLSGCALPALQNGSTRVMATERAKWYPGAEGPKYLDGSLPGDYGFDPLRLGRNKDSLAWFREGEITNGRWAMAAVAGILFTELIGKNPWWTQGAQVDLPLPLNILIVIEIVVFAILEGKRFQNWREKGESGLLNMVPFDPLGMKSAETELKEVKNGRLAMVAFLGFCSQAAVQGKGPIACLQDHLADPVHNNIYTSKVGNEFTLAVIALSITPFLLEAKKAVSPRTDDDTDLTPIPFV